MGSLLSAIGRAQPMNTALKVLDAKYAANQDERRTMLTNSELLEANERIKRASRINQLEEQNMQEMNKVLPVDSLLDSVEGGAESPMAKMLYDTATKYGYIDERGGIRRKDLFEMQKIISQPQYAYKLANTRVDYYKNQINQAKQILAEKPNDKNALQAYQEARMKYEAAFEQVPGVKEVLDREVDLEKAAKTTDRAMKTYMDPNDPRKTVTIPNNEAPPEGYVPYSKPKKGIRVVTDDGTVVEVGGDELSPSAESTTEKQIMGLAEQLQEVTNLENNAFKDVLTLQGKLWQKGLRVADWLKIDIGDDNKKYLGSARGFIEGIEQIFNRYRKEITGAQAAMKEIQMLRDSILNKNLTPTEFEYSLNRYKAQILRSLRLKRMFLRQGVTGKGLGKMIDDAYKSNDDVPYTEIDARGDELAKSGLSKPEVVKQLKLEGYL